MQTVRLVANPGHLELEFFLFGVVMYKIDANETVNKSCGVTLGNETYIRAASMTASLVESSGSFSFSISVLAS